MSANFAPGLVDNLLITAGISFGVQFILWLIHMKTRDATLADWWWGLGYATIALFTYFNTAGVGVESRKLLITALTVLWGVRLSGHLIWRSYRDRNRSIFSFGSYYDPYGWGYSHFSIGFNLWPGYYGSNYWLNDPWAYRLPQTYGPYRWVRYYDDALLVNIYSGQVVDVINNFFW